MGALLAFRPGSDQRAATIALRNVPAGRRFRIVSAPDGALGGLLLLLVSHDSPRFGAA